MCGPGHKPVFTARIRINVPGYFAGAISTGRGSNALFSCWISLPVRPCDRTMQLTSPCSSRENYHTGASRSPWSTEDTHLPVGRGVVWLWALSREGYAPECCGVMAPRPRTRTGAADSDCARCAGVGSVRSFLRRPRCRRISIGGSPSQCTHRTEPQDNERSCVCGGCIRVVRGFRAAWVKPERRGDVPQREYDPCPVPPASCGGRCGLKPTAVSALPHRPRVGPHLSTCHTPQRTRLICFMVHRPPFGV